MFSSAGDVCQAHKFNFPTRTIDDNAKKDLCVSHSAKANQSALAEKGHQNKGTLKEVD